MYYVQIVVDSGVCRRLVELLDHPSSQVVKPALRTIGNVVCAEDEADYTEAILEAGSVVCLKRLIAHPNREIQKEVTQPSCGCVSFVYLVYRAMCDLSLVTWDVCTIGEPVPTTGAVCFPRLESVGDAFTPSSLLPRSLALHCSEALFPAGCLMFTHRSSSQTTCSIVCSRRLIFPLTRFSLIFSCRMVALPPSCGGFPFSR